MLPHDDVIPESQTFEVFSDGSPGCARTVRDLRRRARPSGAVKVLNMKDAEAAKQARERRVSSLPAPSSRAPPRGVVELCKIPQLNGFGELTRGRPPQHRACNRNRLRTDTLDG